MNLARLWSKNSLFISDLSLEISLQIRLTTSEATKWQLIGSSGAFIKELRSFSRNSWIQSCSNIYVNLYKVKQARPPNATTAATAYLHTCHLLHSFARQHSRMAQPPNLPHLPFYAPFLRCHLTTGTFICYTEEGNLNVGLVTEVRPEDEMLCWWVLPSLHVWDGWL